MRRTFANSLYRQMMRNDKVFLITADLGYGMWDKIRDTFPRRFLNVGAAEQVMTDIGIGLALEGKIPFLYSITPFLIYRPFESLRTYVNHEKIPIKLCASGRDKEYEKDGISHWSEDCRYFLNGFENIKQLWPEDKSEIPSMIEQMITDTSPYFISLKR